MDHLTRIQAELQDTVKELAKSKKKYFELEQMAQAVREKADIEAKYVPCRRGGHPALHDRGRGRNLSPQYFPDARGQLSIHASIALVSGVGWVGFGQKHCLLLVSSKQYSLGLTHPLYPLSLWAAGRFSHTHRICLTRPNVSFTI